MKLTSKILLSVLVGNLVGLYVLSHFHSYLMSKLERVIQLEAALDVEKQIEASLRLSEDDLHVKTEDWSKWTDAYVAIGDSDKNANFFKSNFRRETIENLKLNYLAVWNSQQQLLYGQHLPEKAESSLESLDPQIQEAVQEWQKSLFPKAHFFYLKIGDGLALFSLKAIRDVSGTAEPRGAILMGVDFGKSHLQKVKDVVGVEMAIRLEPVIKGKNDLMFRSFQGVEVSDPEALLVQKSLKGESGDSIAYLLVNRHVSEASYIRLIQKYFWWGALFVVFVSTTIIIGSIYIYIIKPLHSVRSQIFKLYDDNPESFIVNNTRDELHDFVEQLNVSKKAHLKDQKSISSYENKIQEVSNKIEIGEISHGMAHELNVPLVTAKTTADILIRKMRQSENFDVEILSEVLKLDLLIKKISKSVEVILGINEQEAGWSSTHSQDFVNEVIQITGERLNAKGIRLLRRDIDNFEFTVQKNRLLRVCLSLIWRAEFQLQSLVEDRWIQVDFKLKSGFVHLRMTDGSPALSLDDQRVLLETSRDGLENSGLLEIRKVVRDWGGDFFYDEDSGKNSFVIVLPQQRS